MKKVADMIFQNDDIQKIKTELSDLNRAYDMKKELEALDDLPAKFLR